ncbi:hypothetical protein AAF712_007101 [Marasmius tenuissimus]|uniref:Uncharacterized protein n=1 Tax=Marasmius tenuissimus TaxID=585030 RepID=A0ABR2ZWL5_9AGAR
MTKQTAQYEYQMKELEHKFSESLSNFRAIDSLLQEAFTGLKRTSKRADRALDHQVPAINNDLEESLKVLTELDQTLPAIRKQVMEIRTLYDSGRDKAQTLVSHLRWLNTEFYERWRVTIFTSSSPVSSQWKIIMRFLFTISFVICCWLAWISVLGGYRAYRHKLVWGERLMS